MLDGSLVFLRGRCRSEGRTKCHPQRYADGDIPESRAECRAESRAERSTGTHRGSSLALIVRAVWFHLDLHFDTSESSCRLTLSSITCSATVKAELCVILEVEPSEQGA